MLENKEAKEESDLEINVKPKGWTEDRGPYDEFYDSTEMSYFGSGEDSDETEPDYERISRINAGRKCC